ncbi:arylamine N-acetyltransferase [candidate division KSB1 bacterium]|nr:arylamine N-acetyltransferase [candidate division KSB1 bacterium]
MNVEAYLQRIDYHRDRTPNAETLRNLHHAHMLAVPFENLDIHQGRPILLAENLFYEKIVLRRRGGFCYEANGLFAALLHELGFNVTLLSARVMDDGSPGPEFDHLTLLMQLEERWLADVGFGDSFREPLRLDDPSAQLQNHGAYRLTRDDEQWTLLARSSDNEWKPQYVFTLRPHQLADFAGRCHYHQTSPESHFTRKRVCSLATPAGRVTLSDMRLIITKSGERQERMLASKEEYANALREYFGVKLD